MERSSGHAKTAGSVVREMNTLIGPVNQDQPGAREALLALAHGLIATLETPSEAIQRIGWAEVQCLMKQFRKTWGAVKRID